MLLTFLEIAGIFVAYLLGSIPTAVFVGKRFYNLDIREHGSGNAGTTNTLRILGKGPAAVVMCVDILKGTLAASQAFLISQYAQGTPQLVNYMVVLGAAAVTGHVFPVFAQFRGGKGIATLLGALLAIYPLVALLCLAVFFLTLFLSNYVSLSSLLASIALPVLIFFIFKDHEIALRIFAIATAVTVIATHQKNINRLVNGTESKTYLFKKKKKENGA